MLIMEMLARNARMYGSEIAVVERETGQSAAKGNNLEDV